MTAGKRINMNIIRDGHVTASELESILETLTGGLVNYVDAVSARIQNQDREISKLRAEIETERRLRLGQGKRK